MAISITILSAGVVCYLLNAFLIRYYVRRKMPNTMDIKIADGTYLWETTAGKGIVPKWVSIIGLLSILLAIIGVVALLMHIFW